MKALKHTLVCSLLASSAFATPVLFTEYQNVWTAPGGDSYYGPEWGSTNYPASTTFYHGSITDPAGGGNAPVLISSSFGQPVPDTLFDFAIGENIVPPAGVLAHLPPLGFVPRTVGDNTNAYYVSVNPADAAIYMPSLGTVVAGVSGSLEIQWQTGSTNPVTRVYNISSIPKTRPNRIFWTEPPYRGPVIDLRVNQQEVYAVFHHNAVIPGPTYGPIVNEGSSGTVTNQTLVGGVLHDQTVNQLHATRVSGLALIEYYRDSNYRESLGVSPVQVLRPDQKVLPVHIGDRLLPEDLFYGTEDLTPDIIAGQNEEKVYLHAPQEENAPKRGYVYAQRRNVEAPWEVEIFWKQTDFRGVLWPFESDWFVQEWPTNAPLYVVSTNLTHRAPVLIGDAALNADIPFQEVPGNAVSEPGQILASVPGRVLVKYSTDDDVWFEVIEAVDHDDPRFDLGALPTDVGQTILPGAPTTFRGDAVSPTYPGFIYTPAGDAYNVNLYRYPTVADPSLGSQIYGVNARPGRNALEVWFASPSRLTDLPTPVFYPGYIERVDLQWPTHAPQLVLASEEGNFGDPAPGRSAFTFPSASQPAVYVQNDPEQHGYNPNEEHALTLNEQVFALRDDLNIGDSSQPFVLTEYAATNLLGEAVTKMATFEVVRTNSVYPEFGSGPLTVPIPLQPPMPLAVLPQAINVRNQVLDHDNGIVDPAARHPIGFRDRKQQWWAKAADATGDPASLSVQYYYALQDSFVFPGDPTPAQTGDLVPWLSGARTGTPINYPYALQWPTNAPQLALAQTLTESPANSGLPNISDQLSARIIYQQSLENGEGESAVLMDPTVRRGTSVVPELESITVDRNWFRVVDISRVELSEPGGTRVLDIRMQRQPASDMTLDFSGSLPDTQQVTVSPTALTFSPDNFADPHFLTLTSIDDADEDGVYRHTLTGLADIPGPVPAAVSIPLLQHDNDSGIGQGIIDTLEAVGKAVRRSPGRTYTFPDVSPALGQRLLYDPDQPAYRTLSLVGENVDTLTGNYLLGNWIRSEDRQILLSFTNVLDTVEQKASWVQAVGRLPSTALTLADDGSPTDSLALTASSDAAQGTGFVTVVFNNSENTDIVPSPLPVSMSVIQVVPELYSGALTVLAPDNPLDEKLTIRQQNDYAARVNQYEFEWRTLPPTTSGLQPAAPFDSWWAYASGTGVNQITVSGASLQTIADNYFVCRYRPIDASGPSGSDWSPWVTAFAPGWVQRAVNGINPYEQRFTDTANNANNPAQSMIELAGGPYNGPVALNPAAVEEAGLIEIYQTLLDRARLLSIDALFDYAPANAALMLAATRLSDLYMLLGNEAYADAQDPTIGFGSDDVSYGAEATKLFAFMNQVPTLLDEELALLRGRDESFAPSPQQGPVHNRLPWNFTRAINGGEVAYALNYNIVGEAGSVSPQITVADAARLYPMGHGDAWGHYLSATRGYYTLLQHPHFTWIPGVGAQLLGGSGDLVVNVDEYDERKFAEAAAAKARTGADIVNRTYRRFYSLDDESLFETYRDDDPSRAWGISGWASRAGQSAYYDWVSAHALLPDTAAAPSRDWALAFTSDTSRVDSGTLYFTPTDGVTYEAWIKPELGTTMPIWTSLREFADGSQRPLELSINGAGILQVAYELESTTRYYFARTAIDANWHHIALVEQQISDTEKTLKLYIDGIDRSPQVAPNSEARSEGLKLSLGVGNLLAPANQAYTGLIDDVRIWNAVLTPAEIQSSSLLHLSGLEEGLLLWYPMLAGQGTTVFDQAGVRHAYSIDTEWTIPQASAPRPPEPNLPAGASFKGILELNREAVPALREIAAQSDYIQRQLDNADTGLNPMGLARDAIPFDIAPTDPASHFEQIYDRALTALNNAAALFDRSAGTTRRLREQFNANRNLAEDLAKSELSYHNRLIEIFGYPYADDIGPIGTYPQGYEGPDLVHYAYVDFADLGLDPEIGAVEEIEVTNLGFNWNGGAASLTGWRNWEFSIDSVPTNKHSFALSEQGFALKPPGWTGRRKAEGRIQLAYADYLKSYYRLRNAASAYLDAIGGLQLSLTQLNESLAAASREYSDFEDMQAVQRAAMSASLAADAAELAWDTFDTLTESTEETLSSSLPTIQAGVVGIQPYLTGSIHSGKVVSAPLGLISATAYVAVNLVKASALATNFAADWKEMDLDSLTTENGYRNEIRWMAMDLEDAMGSQFVELDALRGALVDFQQQEQEFRSILAEGERIIKERMLMRGQGGRQVQQQRYNDLAFRLFRDDHLIKYQQSFDLAARYVYLAAKAYDYETGLLSGEDNESAGQTLLESIVRARSIGELTDRGVPVAADGLGDPGLADIMARMAANWEVVQSRFGLNNPQRVNSHVSLRTELFRIQLEDDTGIADDTWQRTLTAARVADLNTLPEYRRYCRPLGTDATPEPGLVIPFRTTIEPGKNLFGEPLAGGDHSFASSHAATRLRSSAVYFYGYDTLALAAQPQIYLVPVGSDTLRSPTDSAQLRSFQVAEQSLPIPYPVTPGEIDRPDWSPLDTIPGAFQNVRRHATSQAFINNLDADYRSPGSETAIGPYAAGRLVGRSVWNSRWLLIIPGRALLNDPEEGLNRLIYGDGSGTGPDARTGGLKDIRLYLDTYSVEGE